MKSCSVRHANERPIPGYMYHYPHFPRERRDESGTVVSGSPTRRSGLSPSPASPITASAAPQWAVSLGRIF